jgi:uncharacterized protein involved in exopolysaccharide biosynthesis
MQPTEGFTVARRALDVEDYIDILRRHKGWIFGPFLLTLVVSVVGVYLWPDTYKSEALIQIKPPQIAGGVIQVTGQQDIADRINSLAGQVMSRTELTNLIRNLNLYPRERNRVPLEEVLDKMRHDIDIVPSAPIVGGRSVPAFKIIFSYSNRLDAQKVVTQLVGSFLNENVKSSDRNMFSNLEFFQTKTEEAKKQLDDVEEKITQFKLSNPGKTPDQLGANVASMNNMQSTMMAFTQQISRAQSEKMLLESSIQTLKNQINDVNQDAKITIQQQKQVAQKSGKLQQAEANVDRAEQQLAAARKTYTDKTPIVKQLLGQLDVLRDTLAKAQAEEEANKPVIADADPITVANPQAIRDRRLYTSQIESAEAQIKTKDVEVQNLQKQQIQIQSNIDRLNSMIQTMPTGDQVYVDLLREEAIKKDEYLRMNNQLTQAKLSSEVVGRKQGETLEQLESPSLPEDHTDPNRPMVISIGAGLGMVLGLVLAGAREVKDTSLKNLKDVRAYTQMAILGSVPLLENDFVVRRRRRIAWLGWTVACLSAALVMVGAIVYYYTTRV